MEKRRIIIADTELDYIAPIQAKFAETFLNAEPGAVDLENRIQEGRNDTVWQI